MTIAFKVSDNIKPKMVKFYEDKKREKTPPYALFQADSEDTVVTLYESGKVVFQGISADVDASIWIGMEKNLNNRSIDMKTGKDKKEIDKKESFKEDKNFDMYSTIGSDEVGTGDYFGPVVVCATFVDKSMVSYLHELKVNDSKKITDERIKELAPLLIEKIPYSAFILTNKEYNTLNHNDMNLNKIKAILHNKVLVNLVEKNLPYDKIVVDQFAYPKTYFNYIKDMKKQVTNITFTPKAESKCLSVACASIISRYIFLREMYKMGQELGKEIPKGADIKVDEFAKEVAKEKGIDFLSNYVKLNFKNTNKIIDEEGNIR